MMYWHLFPLFLISIKESSSVKSSSKTGFSKKQILFNSSKINLSPFLIEDNPRNLIDPALSLHNYQQKLISTENSADLFTLLSLQNSPAGILNKSNFAFQKDEKQQNGIPEHLFKTSASSKKKSSVKKEGGDSHLSVDYALVDSLLSSYNKEIRPTEHAGDMTYVFLELSLFNVLKLNTKEQMMKTNTEMILKWNDYHLLWKPEDFGGISSVRIPVNDIWVPDIILYNTAEGHYEESLLATNAIISSNGNVELVMHAIFNSICIVDITWYPFDEQDCEMVFASWTYDEKTLMLVMGPADISFFSENPEYFLENFYSDESDSFNPCCEHLMSTITYHIKMQRRTKFSFFFFIMPGILINICAVLVFSLPYESKEKVGLAVNALLAMIIFLMAMTENLPPTEKLPLAGVYYGVCLVLITANMAFTIFVMNVHVSGMRHRKIPQRLKHFIVFLAKIQRNSIPECVTENWGLDEDFNFISEQKSVIEYDGIERINEDRSIDEDRSFTPVPTEAVKNSMVKLMPITDPFEIRYLAALEAAAEVFTSQAKTNRKMIKKENFIDEWRFISRVFDRFFFITFWFITLFFNTVLLTSSPFVEKFEYCPLGEGQCDELTREEIMHLTHAGASGGGDGGGGHGAPSGSGNEAPSGGGNEAPSGGH